jgi:phage gp36-like protein
MKKVLYTLLLLVFLSAVITAGENGITLTGRAGGGEDIMGYCTLDDLNETYGEEQITGWTRYDPDAVGRAINNASAEIDGYLLSGGYPVPISGPPQTIKKYCLDIAGANLVISAGVLENDPGGKAIIEQAKYARQYLGKVAEGKYKIPGHVREGETFRPPSGGVLVSAGRRFDWTGYN